MPSIHADPNTYTRCIQPAALAGGSTLHAVSDPAALTSGQLTLTYTTDNPNYTPDGSVVIADGDTITAAEQLNLTEEMVDQSNKLAADIAAVHAALTTLLDANGVFTTKLAEPTSKQLAGLAALVSLTFTTDDPGLTVNGTTTIADGDLTTAAEFVEYFMEWNKQAALQRVDLMYLHDRVAKIIANRSFAGLTVVPALGSASGGTTVTYTTDAPSITPDGTIVIADGDTITAAERNNIIAEVEAQLSANRADIAAIRTTLNAFLAKVGIS